MSIKARIYVSGKKQFDCYLVEEKKMVKAIAPGNLSKEIGSLVVGDYVQLEKLDAELFQILKIEERSNEIFRVLVREQKKKVTAANCDLLVILNSVSKPKFKRGIIDRFLVRAQQWEIEPIVVFNKMDEYGKKSPDLLFETQRLKELNIKTFEISGLKSNEYKNQYLENGFSELKNYLKNKTTIFVGQSGVGKSETISSLSERKFELKTKAVGKVGKGTHTTTWSEIVNLGEFELIDSPGIRSFSLDDIHKDNLMAFFPDIEKIALHCHFNDCLHDKGSKGCAFFKEGREPSPAELSRLDSYKHFHVEVTEKSEWEKKY